MRPAVRRCLVLVFSLAALAGCGSTFGEKPGATKQSRGMANLWRGSVMLALVVGALVMSLIIWCLLRYRRRGRDDIPSQRQYHLPLEIAYTAIPIVLVLALFGFSWAVQDEVDALSAHPDVTVEVSGFQWQWRFHYRDEGVTIVGLPDRRPTMVVPVGETIRIVLTSTDVVHSFYIPDFLFKRDAIPGITNQFDITVEKPGTYFGQCAEFCGLNHAHMTFQVRAVSAVEFRDWVAQMRQKR